MSCLFSVQISSPPSLINHEQKWVLPWGNKFRQQADDLISLMQCVCAVLVVFSNFYKCIKTCFYYPCFVYHLHFLLIVPSFILLHYLSLILWLLLSSPPIPLLYPLYKPISVSDLILPFILHSLHTLEARSCCWASICCCCLAAISCSSASVMSMRGVATCRDK